jgi:hypothetical protein
MHGQITLITSISAGKDQIMHFFYGMNMALLIFNKNNLKKWLWFFPLNNNCCTKDQSPFIMRLHGRCAYLIQLPSAPRSLLGAPHTRVFILA